MSSQQLQGRGVVWRIAHLTWLAWMGMCQCPSYSIRDCTFFFTNTSCTFLMCTLNAANSSGGISNQWSTCTNYCCSPYYGPNDPKTFSTVLLNCGAQTSGAVPVGITIAVAIGFIVFVLLCIVCCLYFKLVQCTCQCMNAILGHQVRAQHQAPSQLELAPQRMITEEVVVSEEPFEERNNPHLCSICLSEEATLVTHCGHQFHRACLREWMKVRHSCPDCRRNLSERFVIYCSKCLKSYQKTAELIHDQDYLCKFCKL